jgi:beta-lactamase class A
MIRTNKWEDSLIRCFLAALLFLYTMMAVPSSRAQAPAQNEPAPLASELHSKVARQLARIAADFDGVMGISARDLTSSDRFEFNADTVFPQGSSIKIAILIELLRQAQTGTLRLEERVDIKKNQAAAGSGVLQHFGDGSSALSLRDIAALMIVLSDNTATNILIDRVGLENVNKNLDRLGLSHTRLQRRMLDTEAQRAGRENLSSPREMIQLLSLIHQGKTLDAAHTALALEFLGYPKDTPLRRGLPAGIALANKPGSLEGVRCDSGIVMLAGHPYAISVMTTFGQDSEAAERAIGDVSRALYDYFQRVARSNALGVRVQ